MYFVEAIKKMRFEENARLKEELLRLYYGSIERPESEILRNAYYPYFSWRQRRAYFLVPASLLDAWVKPGDCVHFPFLEAEQKICLEYLVQSDVSVEEAIQEDHQGVFSELEAIMLGRTAADIRNWLVDHCEAKSGEWYGDRIILHHEGEGSDLRKAKSCRSKGVYSMFQWLEQRKSMQSMHRLSSPGAMFSLQGLLTGENGTGLSFRKATQARMNSGPFTAIKRLRYGVLTILVQPFIFGKTWGGLCGYLECVP
jgi:hypothetical protein